MGSGGFLARLVLISPAKVDAALGRLDQVVLGAPSGDSLRAREDSACGHGGSSEVARRRCVAANVLHACVGFSLALAAAATTGGSLLTDHGSVSGRAAPTKDRMDGRTVVRKKKDIPEHGLTWRGQREWRGQGGWKG